MERARFQRPSAATLLALVGFALFALFAADGALRGHVVWTEAISDFVPLRGEVARIWLRGEFPFFTHSVFAGLPLFPLAYVGVLYPPNLVYTIAHPLVAYRVLEVWHTFFGAAGLWFYLRSRRLAPLACFFAALALAGGWFATSRMVHPTMRETYMFAPWVLLAARRLMLVPSMARVAVFSAVLAMQVFIGYAHLVMFTIFLVGAEWLTLARADRSFARRTAALAVGGILGLGLSAIQMIPALEMAKDSHRRLYSEEAFLSGSFHPENALRFFHPGAMGQPWTPWPTWREPAELIGLGLSPAAWVLAALAIATAGCASRYRHRLRLQPLYVYTGVALLAMVISLGQHFAPSRAILGLPPFNLFRIPARWFFLVDFSIAIAAAHGLHFVLSWKPWRRLYALPLAWLLWGALCGAVFLATVREWPGGAPSVELAREMFLGSRARVLFLLLPLAVLLVLAIPRRWSLVAAVALVPLMGVEWRQSVFYMIGVPGDVGDALRTERHPLLKDYPLDEITRIHSFSPNHYPTEAIALPAGGALFHGLRMLGGSSAVYSWRQPLLANMGQTGWTWRDGDMIARPDHLHHFAVSHIIIDRRRFTAEQIVALQSGHGIEYAIEREAEPFYLLRLLRARPRYDFAASWRPTPDEPPTPKDHFHFAQIWERTEPVAEREVLIEDPDFKYFPAPAQPLMPAIATVEEERNSYVRLRVEAPEATVLLVRDFHWRGWRWRIESLGGDRYRSVYLANGLLRAVPIPAGTHTVELRYRPPGWNDGVRYSAISLGALVQLLVAGRFFVPRRRDRESLAG